MKKVVNITAAKHNLLKIIGNLEAEVIITRDYEPVAVLAPLREENSDRRPALIVLGAKPCPEDVSRRSIEQINRAGGLFGKVVVVYSPETEKLLSAFRHSNLLVVATAKKEHPIVTSLKAGLAGCGPGDNYFMFTFLNQPQPLRVFTLLAAAITRAEEAGKGIIVPRRQGRPTHPLVFAGRYKQNILKIRKELGIPHIIKRHADDIFYQEIEAVDA